MPILNYTTTIDPVKTVGEIQAILVRGGAQRVRIEYKNSLPSAVEFSVDTPTLGVQHFRFAPNIAGVLESLKRAPKVPSSARNETQAARVAWRIEKDWLEAQFAKLDAMRMPLEQIMLPYMVTNKGETLYETLKAQHLALPAGTE